jgi:hypothetical protein
MSSDTDGRSKQRVKQGGHTFNKTNPKIHLRGTEDNIVSTRRYKRCNDGGKSESGEIATGRSVFLITMYEIRKTSKSHVEGKVAYLCNKTNSVTYLPVL